MARQLGLHVERLLADLEGDRLKLYTPLVAPIVRNWTVR